MSVYERGKKDLAKGKKSGQRGENVTEAPRMKVLMARLNAKIFQVYPPDDQAAPSSTVGQEEGEDDDDFARAFQEEITLGMYHSLLSPLSQNI
jgi:hypothetical protein